CANCRMQSLFDQASEYLKRRHAEIERRIDSEDVGGNSHGYDYDDPFDWNEFEQLYYRCDLFKWHRDAYLGDDGILNLEGMKLIWMEYEKSFIEDTKKRIFQNRSKNAKTEYKKA
ncbi:hypothetical protein BGZ65_005458, partial [Modicella reniformis]